MTFFDAARNLSAQVQIEFPLTTETFDGDDLFRVELVEEASNIDRNPLGFVSSNQLTIALNNGDRNFTPTGSWDIRPGLKISPTITIVGAPDAPLGSFWCGDWETPTNSLEARTQAYDRLMNLLTIDVPQIPPMIDTTLGEMFARLFRGLGLDWDDYIISPALNKRVRVGWFGRDKVGSVLQQLTEAGNCFVSVNRDNKIIVMPNLTTGTSSATLNDTNVYTLNNPQRIKDIYTAVKVIYRLPYSKDANDELVKVEGIELKPGTTVLDRIDFRRNDIPIRQIDWVHIYGDYAIPDSWEVGVGDGDGTFKLGRRGEDIYNVAIDATVDITRQIDMDETFSMPQYVYDLFIFLFGVGAVTEEATQWTGDIAYDADADTAETELETLYGADNVEVVKRGTRFRIVFKLDIGDSRLVADFDNLNTTLIDGWLTQLREYAPIMGTEITSVSYGATDITVTVHNPNPYSETINLLVKGIGTGWHDAHKVEVNQARVDDYGYRELSQENQYIQTSDLATEYAESLLSYVSDPLANFEIDYRGDPNIQVGDIVTVQSDKHNIPATLVMPRRIDTVFDGSLRSKILARRVVV